MRADAWIVDYLVKKGVTDVFGIPGVVVMDFLYAVDRRKPDITPHLSYHEQGAAFAASGYAQASGKLGVAYATRGPGMTNMITAIADAYCDSIPVMYITAHSSAELQPEMRVLNNQEIDTVSLVSHVTKHAVRVDTLEDLQREVMLSYHLAMTGRRGPVFLDILSGLFRQEVPEVDDLAPAAAEVQALESAAADIEARFKTAKRPVILIGSGTRSHPCPELVCQLAAEFGIPILSSRTAQDVVPAAPEYFGFVGSRATRHSNFILSKADLILSLGNRLAFPTQSKSFSPVVEKAFTFRVDADASEFIRPVPNSKNICADAADVLQALLKRDLSYDDRDGAWLGVCRELRDTLQQWDRIPVIENVMQILKAADPQMPVFCDVGNHSFWITTAYAYSGCSNRILYSGSFGTLGSALPKAIGGSYSAACPAVCFVGDQGFQMNIQELQFIASHALGITVVVLNNASSGMIMEREIARYGDYLVHTTLDSGYSHPNFKAVAEAYGIEYHCIDTREPIEDFRLSLGRKPMLIELLVEKDTELNPNLPIGKPCQDLMPALPRELYQHLDEL